MLVNDLRYIAAKPTKVIDTPTGLGSGAQPIIFFHIFTKQINNRTCPKPCFCQRIQVARRYRMFGLGGWQLATPVATPYPSVPFTRKASQEFHMEYRFLHHETLHDGQTQKGA